ncbi:Nitrous oxide-stimulated promoter [Shewanella psychrophila]|uniref:Nitrous oxide-stimulated promoter n=1 Tax=Shewanella psychrophila TaxID=225848 RepID=A0A1S6HS83_9GAMM|nr:nitrous oxide-stimulated promoter family protein [Shewanella psychrophila]AQS38383.1 Nitrous oxide-stimulated promoter [Shewanella psychrophila]
MANSALLSGKLLREYQTIAAMVEIYCKAHKHNAMPVSECQECQKFLTYARTKLDRCPYGQDKPTCNKCPVHCYKPHMKEKAREIMVFSGPKMLLPHPIMAIRHLLSGRTPVTGKPPANQSNRHLRKQRDAQ